MGRRTTTQQITIAISNNLLHIKAAEKYRKSTHQTDAISPETFKESLDFLCESVFSDCISWHFEYDVKTKQYIVECSRMDGDSEFIIIAHLCVNESMNKEVIDNALSIEEE